MPGCGPEPTPITLVSGIAEGKVDLAAATTTEVDHAESISVNEHARGRAIDGIQVARAAEEDGFGRPCV